MCSFRPRFVFSLVFTYSTVKFYFKKKTGFLGVGVDVSANSFFIIFFFSENIMKPLDIAGNDDSRTIYCEFFFFFLEGTYGELECWMTIFDVMVLMDDIVPIEFNYVGYDD